MIFTTFVVVRFGWASGVVVAAVVDLIGVSDKGEGGEASRTLAKSSNATSIRPVCQISLFCPFPSVVCFPSSWFCSSMCWLFNVVCFVHFFVLDVV